MDSDVEVRTAIRTDKPAECVSEGLDDSKKSAKVVGFDYIHGAGQHQRLWSCVSSINRRILYQYMIVCRLTIEEQATELGMGRKKSPLCDL